GVATQMLDKLRDELNEASKMYKDDAAVQSLFASVGKTQAQPYYHKAQGIDATVDRPGGIAPDADYGRIPRLEKQAVALREEGAKEVSKVNAQHPIVDSPDFPKESLSGCADAPAVKALLVEYIAKHLADVEKTRGTIAEEGRIYKLDKLLKEA